MWVFNKIPRDLELETLCTYSKEVCVKVVCVCVFVLVLTHQFISCAARSSFRTHQVSQWRHLSTMSERYWTADPLVSFSNCPWTEAMTFRGFITVHKVWKSASRRHDALGAYLSTPNASKVSMAPVIISFSDSCCSDFLAFQYWRRAQRHIWARCLKQRERSCQKKHW